MTDKSVTRAFVQAHGCSEALHCKRNTILPKVIESLPQLLPPEAYSRRMQNRLVVFLRKTLVHICIAWRPCLKDRQ